MTSVLELHKQQEQTPEALLANRIDPNGPYEKRNLEEFGDKIGCADKWVFISLSHVRM